MIDGMFLGEPFEVWNKLKYLVKTKGFESVSKFVDTVEDEDFETAKLESELALAKAKLNRILTVIEG